jgi:hypothetical protein
MTKNTENISVSEIMPQRYIHMQKKPSGYSENWSMLHNTCPKREQKKRISELEVELTKEFEEPLKNLTKLQGKIMIKMIEKETGKPIYHLIKDLKGGFKAFYWNMFSKLYSYDLKEGYNKGQYPILDAVLQDFDVSYRIENETSLKYVKLNRKTIKSSIRIGWESPSNIALIKYWGKYGKQLPRNPSVSFTLHTAATELLSHGLPMKSWSNLKSHSYLKEVKKNHSGCEWPIL